MGALHLTKVAVGCADADALAAGLAARAAGGETFILTRYRPTRGDEMAGGSLYWIIRHQLVARSPILGFADQDGRCRIRLAPGLVPVRIRPRRAHQGWRYLKGEDAPPDLAGAADELASLPPRLMSELATLGLV